MQSIGAEPHEPGTTGEPRVQAPGYSASVYPASMLTVLAGANAGDPLPPPADSVPGDYYRLTDTARAVRLVLHLPRPRADGQPVAEAARIAGHIGRGSALGTPGAPLHLLGQLSLMAPDGDLVEVLVLENAGTGRLALPLSPLRARLTYTLIATDPRPAPLRLADVVTGAFARGTRIAMSDGRQIPVEDMRPGMTVITRDHGPQALRWKGMVRLRAEGGFAPVVILPGVMGNPGALVVSPYHRLFLYRPGTKALTGAAELLIQARHLVDDQGIIRRKGGQVEYHSLVFDRHEVIYAEGVPCESLMVCPSTMTRLPDDLAAPLRRAFPGLEQRLHPGAYLPAQIVSRLRDAEVSPPGAVPATTPL